MEYDDEYTTIHGMSRIEIYIKKSKFIGLSASANTEKDAMNFINSVRAEFSDASHVCYAFSIGFGAGRIFRSNDAGEPANSAGKPILSAVESSGFHNIVCVVVRYFGGIKLGVGGLIRAYGQAARESIKNAKSEIHVSTADLRVEMPYDYIGAIVNLVARLKGKILSMDHGEKAQALVNIRSSLVPTFREHIKTISDSISVRT